MIGGRSLIGELDSEGAMAHSPVGDNLPLREYTMHYQASPSPMTSQSPLTSPPPESACSIPVSQIDVESSATLSWREIKVVIHHSGTRNEVVLDGITGYAEPYRMLAIMGPPRSGKSALLQTLAGRLTRKATYHGEIHINGRRQQLTYGVSAFLTSDDVLPETLTVKEHLCLSALLRLPSSLPRREKLAVAEHIMAEMGLKDVACRYVRRCPVKGISAGERRTLSLAVELLIGPYLIYFDDAIKGLEVASALSLLMKIKGLSKGGCTVIMSIEHASSHVHEFLDDLCLLSSGKMVYFGDNSSALEHFSTAGFPCPPLHNPGDHYLYTLGAEYEKLRAPYQYVQDTEKAEPLANEDNHNIVQFLTTSYQNSDSYTALVSKVNALVKKKGGVLVNRTKHAGFCHELIILSYRSLLNTTRALGFYWMRLFLAFLLMLSIGTIFLRLDHSGSSIEARASCIFLALEGMLFLSVGGVPYLYHETKMHLRERMNCQYGVAKFVLANSIASLPILLIISVVPLCSMYFLVGLHPGVLKFIYFATNLYLSLIVSESLMMAISTAVPNVYSGMMIGACIQVLFMLVGGFVRHVNDFPTPFWRFPLSYISFHAHSLRGLFQNEFLGSHFGSYTGAYVAYESYHMSNPGKWWSLLILGGMAIFYRMLAIAFHSYFLTRIQPPVH